MKPSQKPKSKRISVRVTVKSEQEKTVVGRYLQLLIDVFKKKRAILEVYTTYPKPPSAIKPA